MENLLYFFLISRISLSLCSSFTTVNFTTEDQTDIEYWRAVQLKNGDICSFYISGSLYFHKNESEYILDTEKFKNYHTSPATSLIFKEDRLNAFLISGLVEQTESGDEHIILSSINQESGTIIKYNNSSIPNMEPNNRRASLSLLPTKNYLIAYMAEDMKNCIVVEFNPNNKNFQLKKKLEIGNETVGSGVQCDFNSKIDKYLCFYSQYIIQSSFDLFIFDESFTQIDKKNFTHESIQEKVLSLVLYKKSDDFYLIKLTVDYPRDHIIYFDVPTNDYNDVKFLYFGCYTGMSLGVGEIEFILDKYYLYYGSTISTQKVIISYVYIPLIKEIFFFAINGKSIFSTFTNSYDTKNNIYLTYYQEVITIYEFHLMKCNDMYINVTDEETHYFDFKDFYEWSEDHQEVDMLIVEDLNENRSVVFEGKTRNDLLATNNIESLVEFKEVIKSPYYPKVYYYSLRYKYLREGDTMFEFLIKRKFGDLLLLPTIVCKLTFHSELPEPEEKEVSEEPKLDNEEKKIDCYDTCETCLQYGNSLNHNCLTCKNNYFPLNTITGKREDESICVPRCNLNYSYWYIERKDNINKFTCTNGKLFCPKEYPFYYNETKECRDVCGKSNNCAIKFESNITLLIEIIHQFNSELFIKKKDIIGVNFTIKFIEIIKGVNEYKIDLTIGNMLYLRKEIRKNEENIKEKEGYEDEDDVAHRLVVMSILNGSSLIEVKMFIFDRNGEKIQLSNFQDVYTIKTDINNYIDLPQDDREIVNKGALSDYTSAFYNDYCFPVSIRKNDLVLSDRRKSFSSITLCGVNCKFVLYNKTDQNVQCNCIPQNDSIVIYNNTIDKNALQFTQYSMSNFKLINCVKKASNLFKNYGFDITIILLLLHISNFILGKFWLSPPLNNKINSLSTTYIYVESKDHLFETKLTLATTNDQFKNKCPARILSKTISESQIIPKFVENNKQYKITKISPLLSFREIFMRLNPICKCINTQNTERLINISLLITSITFRLFLNVMLHNEEIISFYYVNNKQFDFAVEITKVTYSVLIAWPLDLVIKYIAYFMIMRKMIKKNINENIQRPPQDKLSIDVKKQKKDGIKEENNFDIGKRKVSLAMIIYFIIVIDLHIIMMMYILSFCFVFKYSVANWAISSFLTLILFFFVSSFIWSLIIIGLWWIMERLLSTRFLLLIEILILTEYLT